MIFKGINMIYIKARLLASMNNKHMSIQRRQCTLHYTYSDKRRGYDFKYTFHRQTINRNLLAF